MLRGGRPRVGVHAASLRRQNRWVVTTGARRSWVVVTVLALIAVNLRTALSSIPAVESEIQMATGWSNAAIGVLTTIPVVSMGVLALAVPRISRRFGRRGTVALAMAVLVAALAMRLQAGVPWVLVPSVLLAGTGIALAAGLVPSVVRDQVPHRVGFATGVWTGAMMLGAALGGALTVPLSEWLGSWQRALAIWAAPALIAFVVWWRVEGLRDAPTPVARPPVRIRDLPWRSRPGWALTGFLLTNSIVFYTLLAWLAPSFVDRGWSQEDAGFLFGAFTVSQVAAALTMPLLAERMRARRSLYAGFVTLCLVGVLGLGATSPQWAVAWVLLVGFTLGGTFAMGLALLSEFAEDAHSSARLTAMAFFATYTLAALGPLVAGALLDAGWSWMGVYLLVAVVAAAQLVTIAPLRRGVRL